MNSELQTKKLKELFSARFNKEFTEEDIKNHCVGVIYNGLVNKEWSLNGIKINDIEK